MQKADNLDRLLDKPQLSRRLCAIILFKNTTLTAARGTGEQRDGYQRQCYRKNLNFEYNANHQFRTLDRG